MKLIIAEKPDLGHDIAKAIEGTATERDGVIRKGDYVITWVFGHLLQLREPEVYNPEYAAWNMESLPIHFPDWEMDPIPGKAARVKQIQKLVSEASLIIHAGDPDDEGQLLIDELLRFYNYTGPVKRLDTADTSTKSLKRALNNLKDNEPLEASGWSAYARAVSDYVVGINMSRYFTLLNRRKLSVGRVQTPTLGLVVNRDLQIENHKKICHYEWQPEVQIGKASIPAKFHYHKDSDVLEDGRVLSRLPLQELQEQSAGQTVSCNVTKTEKATEPPLPFNLVKLQSYCGKKWKYKPAEVMEITQALREKYHAITYNRSDCQYLTTEHYLQAPETVQSVLDNLQLSGTGFDPKRKSRCFNDANITAHFAIIPTSEPLVLNELTEKERNVYTAVAYHYLVQFLPSSLQMVSTLEIKLQEGTIKASSSETTEPGFTAFLTVSDEETETEDQEDAPALASIPAGSYSAQLKPGQITEKETKPPARYTQTSLNEDMTRIAKYVTDPEVKRLLKEKDKGKKGEHGSIGTSATRSGIISELIRKGFLIEEKGKLISTPVGREFYRILPNELKLPDMTAHWYVLQEEIKNGAAPDLLIENVLDTIRTVMSKQHETIAIEVKKVGECPLCGSSVAEREKGYFCTSRECPFVIWKQISGKTITPSIAEQLLQKRRTSELKGFKSKSGSSFSASLILDLTPEKNYVAFDFSKPEGTRRGTSSGSRTQERRTQTPTRRRFH